MDIVKPKVDVDNPKVEVNKSEKVINKPKKDHRSYFVLAFVICIIVFVFLGWQWVKKDNDTKTIEDSFKAELLKNPVKTNMPLPSNQTSSQSASQTSASSQMAQNPPMDATQPSQNSDATMPETQPQNIAPSTAPTESTENKKFESTKLKVSFDYPKEVTVSESDKLITLSKPGISWKIRFYDNNNKKEFQAWYTSHFDIKTEADCSFTDGTIKVGSYTSKLVKASSDSVKCDGDGNYAINADKSTVVKVELGKETAENSNKILTSFKFTE
jgi:hypothetical protein